LYYKFGNIGKQFNFGQCTSNKNLPLQRVQNPAVSVCRLSVHIKKTNAFHNTFTEIMQTYEQTIRFTTYDLSTIRHATSKTKHLENIRNASEYTTTLLLYLNLILINVNPISSGNKMHATDIYMYDLNFAG
jgi:hypothetical protein